MGELFTRALLAAYAEFREARVGAPLPAVVGSFEAGAR
jgi:hypothetical protein